jgi:hypothetical protein
MEEYYNNIGNKAIKSMEKETPLIEADEPELSEKSISII